MAPETAETRPARKGPTFLHFNPDRRSGGIADWVSGEAPVVRDPAESMTPINQRDGTRRVVMPPPYMKSRGSAARQRYGDVPCLDARQKWNPSLTPNSLVVFRG